jgi:hypothetical protein
MSAIGSLGILWSSSACVIKLILLDLLLGFPRNFSPRRFYMDPFFQVLFLQEGEFEQGMEDELDGLADASEPLSLDSVADLSTAASPEPIVSA